LKKLNEEGEDLGAKVSATHLKYDLLKQTTITEAEVECLLDILKFRDAVYIYSHDYSNAM
jgi:hypothetical protein